MAGEWRDSTVQEEVDILLGFAFKSADFATAPPGHRLLRGDNVKRGTIEWGEKSRYWREVTTDLKKYALRAGDVVVGMDGSRVGENFARVSQEDLPALLVQRVACLRTKSDLDQAYLRYLICNPEFTAYIKAVHTGTSIPHVSGGQIGAYAVLVPPRDEQRAIAHILGTLDDKIELNRRMSETLETMARALFKSWFVDFDPVRAKAEGRDPGLPDAIADLFPGALTEYPGLGEIPKGWRACCVDDEFDITMGQSPPGSTYNEIGEGLPFYQGRADFGVRFPSRRVFCTAPTRLAKAGDTLITVRAPVGDINTAWENCAIGRGVAAARHKTGSRSYTYLFMHGLAEKFERFEAEGTVFGSINKKDFHAIPCIGPPSIIVHAFETAVALLDGRLEANDRESHTLAALRDALLPRLISGYLRLNNSERILGKAG